MGAVEKGVSTMIDRSEANRALAKAIAYKQCGKNFEAAVWAAKLVVLLESAHILHDAYVDRVAEGQAGDPVCAA